MSDIELIKLRLMGPKFTRLLKSLKTSKYAIARDCGIAWRTLRYWEVGKQKPSDELAMRVAEHLGILEPKETAVKELVKRMHSLQKDVDRILKK